MRPMPSLPVISISAWLISSACGAAFQRARPGDQRQRPVIAEREVADMDGARRFHGYTNRD